MSAQLTPKRIADDVFEIDVATADAAQALAGVLRGNTIAEEVVAGLSKVALRFDPADAAQLETYLETVSAEAFPQAHDLEVVEIEITYGGEDGPDFDWVCQQLDLTKDAFIHKHGALEHQVDMIGFTPGFSYISGVPPAWAIPRLDQPRSRVAAGSVGISAGYTGIYALAGPGGWPLIGRTRAPLFDANAAEPFLLTPSQRVKFRPA